MIESKVLNRVFHDAEGNIVLAQTPNLPLIVWGVASSLQLIVTTGKVNSGLNLLAFGALFTWAWLELFDGVNYFRRLLGLLILLLAISSKI
ncbi:hypothetical protein Pse7429DRAFT_4225 [Pseudanabaena biceps PCC 7429]|uniref:Uncharacterized protein n=1 Tax=Pseudanabaena biceps PCC 7429 TaxID=927668 RepID=L8MV32_9CYAN|nr:hypothetical protein Pse7429DRAFT_4225 [Pseudanabaena biceps PCC 7429]